METQFVRETLVTDTRVWEVIKRTPKTITIRSTQRTGEIVRSDNDGSGYPVNYEVVAPDPDGRVKTVRLRKDGTYRTYQGGKALRPVEGTPTERTDYRF